MKGKSKLSKLLSSISTGKHALIMHHEGESDFTQPCGGIWTLLLYAFILCYSTVAFIRCFNRGIYTLERDESLISENEGMFKVVDMREAIFQRLEFDVMIDKDDGSLDCTKINFTVLTRMEGNWTPLISEQNFSIANSTRACKYSLSKSTSFNALLDSQADADALITSTWGFYAFRFMFKISGFP